MPQKLIDISGQRFGRLVVQSIAARPDGGGTQWRCVCDCGKVCVTSSFALRHGRSVSCGCKNRETLGASRRTHGRAGSPEYSIWAGMHTRCSNPSASGYARYGGRGIKVCARWSEFVAFLSDMGPRPSSRHALDRIDNDGDYEPGNVRWAERETQANNCSTNVIIEWQGRRQTIAQWSKEVGLTYSCLRSRLNRGHPPEVALSTQRMKYGPKSR